VFDSISCPSFRPLLAARRALALFAALLSLLALQACATSGASKGAATKNSGAAAEEAPKEPRLLAMWEVKKAGLPTSWLFGTCHMGVTVDEALPRDYRALLEGAGRFVMEVDPSTMDPAVMNARLTLPEGQTLSAMIGEELWAKLVDAHTLGPAAPTFNKLHPFALLAYVMSQMANELQPAAAGKPMDFELSTMAAASGVQHAFLETLDQQLDVFLGMPMDELVKGLGELTDPAELDKMKEALEAVLEVCRSGDSSGLDKQRAESDDQDWEELVFIERNQNWLPKLDSMFSEASTFVAVGAGHMYGEQGLVDLLRQRGYTVRQMEGVTMLPSEVTSEGVTYPLAFILSQMTEHASATMCAPEQVPVQCNMVSADQCRTLLSESIQQCGVDLKFSAEVSQQEMEAGAPGLAQCMALTFQSRLPPPQESEACSAAMELLK